MTLNYAREYAMSRSRKALHASSCKTAMYSSALCAWSIEPGPMTTVGMPGGKQAGFGTKGNLAVLVTSGEPFRQADDVARSGRFQPRELRYFFEYDASGRIDPAHPRLEPLARMG